jgi:hypothetical protein
MITSQFSYRTTPRSSSTGMHSVKGLQHAHNMRNTRPQHAEMQDLMTGTEKIKRALEAPFRKLQQSPHQPRRPVFSKRKGKRDKGNKAHTLLT